MRCCLNFALSAVAAPIAGRAHTAGIAAFPEHRLVAFLIVDRISKLIVKFKAERLSLEAHTRLICLLTLQSVPLYFVEFAVLDEASASSAENEAHVVVNAFLPQ